MSIARLVTSTILSLPDTTMRGQRIHPGRHVRRRVTAVAELAATYPGDLPQS